MEDGRGSGRLQVALLMLALATGVTAAQMGSRVHFSDGRSMDVISYRVEGDQAVLSLPGGGLLTIDADRIVRVEPAEIEDPPEKEAARTPAPATTAAPAAAAPPQPTPTARRDEQPAAQSIETLIREAALRHGLEVDLLAAVIAVESGFRPTAVSPKGAKGLMQLMPGTARELAVTDPFDPAQSIDAGARYLRQLLDANDGKYWRALAAYNAGSGRVARYGGLPPYRETINYIRRVLDNYASPRPIPSGAAGTGIRPSSGSAEPSGR